MKYNYFFGIRIFIYQNLEEIAKKPWYYQKIYLSLLMIGVYVTHKKEKYMELIPGVYEQIINQLFERKLNSVDTDKYCVGKKDLNKSEAVKYLSRYLYGLFKKAFLTVSDNEESVDRCTRFANFVIKKLGAEFSLSDSDVDLFDIQSKLLTYVIEKEHSDYADIQEYIRKITPITTLSSCHLFTGKDNTVTMASELKKEILSADEICLIVSFIKKSGLRNIIKELKEFTQNRVLRVITTTYMQASDFDAIKEIALLKNTEVKVSYNSDLDRLHAKGYLFLRKTGFHTAYIGSSNLSNVALNQGLEWNLKVTQVELPDIINNIRKSFEGYWNDESFVTFIPEVDDERLKYALGEVTGLDIDYSVLDLIKAKTFQREILEKLDNERNVHNNNKNLIVAATGTGKTVMAAFDYKRFKESHPERHNFLFVVHREEIIKQACATFRRVLEDENFGEMWYGGKKISKYSHVFASKDLLNNRLEALELPKDYYDYIIIDEAHHAPAGSYTKRLEYFTPKILLGLTATPERMDSQDVTKFFNSRISAEIRLTEALNAGLLAPFRYFGITDCVDLEDVRWANGRFVASELSKVYTNNDQRTNIIFKSIEKYLTDYSNVRALCFCVSKEHAKYMAAKFTLAGLKADVLTSDDSDYHRKEVRRNLERRKINYLFVVDIFNEGVDIKEIDTVLFLRPTESLTIFLQQLGRGLRKLEGKDYLTVLDFVGHSRAEFNYLDRFRALTGKTSMSVKEEIERDFPHLPLNCYIELEEKAKDYILENINSYVNGMSKRRIVNRIANFSNEFDMPLTLTNFLKVTNIPLEKIYKSSTWNGICEEAQVPYVASKHRVELQRMIYKKWLSVDSYSYFSFVKNLVDKRFKIDASSLCLLDKKRTLMFYYDMFDTGGIFTTLQDFFDTLSKDEAFISELSEVLELLLSRCKANELNDNSAFALINPLMLHGIYTRAQIQVAIETSNLLRKSSSREGVERNASLRVEAMYVDIIKDRELGSTTDYNDYANSIEQFHWQTQNSAGPHTPAGRNYINQVNHMLLFVREQATDPDDKSRRLGYVYLGEVELESYNGSQPMNIIWKLKNPMPSSTFNYAALNKAIGY